MMPRIRLARRLRRMGIGTLPVLAGILMASGLIRLGDFDSMGRLGALGLTTLGAASAADTEAEPGEAPADQVDIILSALKARETQLDEREDRLARREARLAEIESKLRDQMNELAASEEKLSELLKLAKSAVDDDLVRLTTVYENMAPKDAAALFAEMAPVFAAGFLSRMQPASAAAILAGLDPQTAYSISVIIAGRNANILQGG